MWQQEIYFINCSFHVNSEIRFYAIQIQFHLIIVLPLEYINQLLNYLTL